MTTISRRNFIRAAGASAAMSVVPPVATARDRPLTFGLLLPSSRLYPILPELFYQGITAYAAESEQRIKAITSPIGYDAASVRMGIESLLGKVDILVGLVNNRVIPFISPLLERHQTFLVASSLGENFIRQSDKRPFVVYSSLNLWQSNWALGSWAASHLGTRAVMSASAYDSGYDAFAAFRLGYQASGGEIVHLHLSDLTSYAEITAVVQEYQPNFVYAAYCGQDAKTFVQTYQRAGLMQRTPLIGSPFLVEAAETPGIKTAALTLNGLHPITALGYQAAAQAVSLENKQTYTHSSESVYLHELGAVPAEFSINLPDAQFKLEHEGIISGWFNPYLCL
ncbi:MAG: ABC transporter substrate-binding protein [Anaerolineae bacterium]|nr:ABC transporter substrate-binding protein [Anaerolineae bacterium]